MKNLPSFLTHCIVLCIGFVISNPISAAIRVEKPEGVTLPPINESPELALASIIQYFILLTAVLAVMAITWGGIGFIMSTGDDEKMKKSRKTIIYAFVGVVVSGLAYAIVEAITRMQLN